MASDKTSLGDRMKGYEHATRTVLPPRTYSLLRVDGRAFHSLLRHADKPFDDAVIAAMNTVGEALCTELSGAVFAYTQSDECSVLLTDFTAPGTQPMFGGVVQKIVSVAASTATVAFNAEHGYHYDGPPGMFDARIFSLADPVEVANYFLWRQRDCVRNSISMAAQACFSHRRLHKLNGNQMQELLWQEKQINWNDYPDGCKRGRVTTRHTGEREITYVDKRTQEENTTTAVRSWWETHPAPHFTAQPDGWLAEAIPVIPSFDARRPA
jgi:tRNA(His) guanylyltransferase